MKRPLCILCYLTVGTLVAAVAGVLGAASALAQAPAPQKPTEHHEILKRDAGTWDVKSKLFIPGQDATESKAVEKNQLIAGGLWLVTDYEGEIAGEKFIGHGITGYDAGKKKYVGTWVDNMNAAQTSFEGEYDAKTKTLTITAEVADPNSGMKLKQTQVTVWKDDDTKVFTITMDIPGLGELKILENTAKRRKEKKK